MRLAAYSRPVGPIVLGLALILVGSVSSAAGEESIARQWNELPVGEPATALLMKARFKWPKR